MHFLEALRAANTARNVEWEMPNNPFTLTFWANELAGEAGEACNILKKLERERLGAVGSRAPMSALADELADVVICCDLMGMHQSITFAGNAWPTAPAPADSINYSLWGVRLDAHVGRISMLSMQEDGPRNLLLPSALKDTLWQVKFFAGWAGFDIERGIATKFNMTSEKNGLRTRLVW